jgi:hypothetical protein
MLLTPPNQCLLAAALIAAGIPRLAISSTATVLLIGGLWSYPMG